MKRELQIGIGLLFLGGEHCIACTLSHKCQCSRLSSVIIGLQNNSNSVDCKVLIKPAMHNLLPRSLNCKWKFAQEHLHFAQKSLRLFGVNTFNAVKSCINFNYINDFMLQYLWAQPPSARGGGGHMGECTLKSRGSTSFHRKLQLLITFHTFYAQYEFHLAFPFDLCIRSA